MKKTVFLILLFIGFIACEKELIKEEFENTPTGNFEAFWTEFDKLYGAFEAKHINWDSLKIVYGAGINNSSSNHELFTSLSGLLACLNDGHADIYAQGIGVFRSWSRRDKSYFADISTNDFKYVAELQGLVRKNYLLNRFQSTIKSGWLTFYGKIDYEDFTVGYLCIPTFIFDSYPKDFIEEAAENFIDCDAIIIDVRFNGGGATETLVNAINVFSSESKLYMKSKFRNGPKHTDFTDLFDHYTKPKSDNFKNKPIAILMNSFTCSSSEHFILGLKSQQGVFTVGDTTCGAFSGIRDRVLPNGWIYRLGAQVIYDTNGNLFSDENGNYLEGIGIAPDYYVPDMINDAKTGNDLPMETALKELVKRLK